MNISSYELGTRRPPASRGRTWAALALAAGTLIAAPAAAATTSPARATVAMGHALPAGLALKDTEQGLTLTAADGQPVYRLDTDRVVKRRPGTARLIQQRCGDLCQRLWRPLPAPAGFKAGGDWTITQRDGVAQLAYKGDPLYTFAGQSLDEAAAAEVAVVPPFFTSYTSKPLRFISGVPVSTVYWHPVLYQPAPLKVAVPPGVALKWERNAHLFADSEQRPLYASKSGAACLKDCGGLAPLPAPFAALPTGDWRPVDDASGRYWSYKGRIVHRPTSAGIDAAGDWEPLQAR